MVNPILAPKADIQMLIYVFTRTFTQSTSQETQHYPESHLYVSTQKTKISFYLVCFFSTSRFLLQGPGKKKRRRPLFAARLLKRLYRAWQRGSACPSLVVLFILCGVQGVSNALRLCVGRETTHHILSSVLRWGMGGGGLRRAVQQKGDKKQTYRRPRLFKVAMHKGL